ncbi:MAG: diphthine--ammonia ligase [Anaerolineales bacterium]
MKNRAILAWSGGKDSALALYEMTRQDRTQVVALLTTVTEGYDRISMHGVRRELLAEQAKALGYPLEEVRLPQQCTNELYEQRTGQALEKYHQSGIARAAFGDLFLEDVRAYREERLSRIGMRGIFPLWGRNTSEVARQFVGLGFRAVVICVDTQALDRAFAGRDYDEDLLKDLPPEVDPCGENGEFHTFVYAGPLFHRPVRIERGEKILRENRFYYCDLVAGQLSR